MCAICMGNIWVATLKVKVTAWPWIKIVSAPLLRYLKSDFKTISQKWSAYGDNVSRARFGLLPWRSRSQHDLAINSCPPHNLVIWSRILQLFHRNDHHIETTCPNNIWVDTLKVKVTAWPCNKFLSPHNLVENLKLDFTTVSQKWSPYNYWDHVSRKTFGSIPWRSRSQHDLAAKTCPAHNFVIWSRMLKIFHRNDHHIETTCGEQHLGCYLEGQGHSMTLH